MLALFGQIAKSTVPVASVAVGAGIRARLDASGLTVAVDSALVAQRDGPQLGLEVRQAGLEGEVRILLEKDMQRLNPKPDEGPADVYPNPLFGKKRCDHD